MTAADHDTGTDSEISRLSVIADVSLRVSDGCWAGLGGR